MNCKKILLFSFTLIFIFLLLCAIIITDYNRKRKNFNDNVKTIYRKEDCPQEPQISIIIPIYNSSPWLRECLDSCINQTFKNIEIICINDGSKDNSLNILFEYQQGDHRIVIIDKYNGGSGDSRNKGLSIAKGQYIMFLDSDDYFSLDACEKCYKSITENNADMAVFGWNNFCDSECKQKDRFKNICKDFSLVKEKQIVINDFKNTNKMDHPYLWTKIYKRDIIDKVKFLNFSVIDDATWFLSIYKKVNKIVYNADIICFHRLHDSNISLKRDFFSMWKNFRAFIVCSYFLNKNYNYPYLDLIKLYKHHLGFYKGEVFN